MMKKYFTLLAGMFMLAAAVVSCGDDKDENNPGGDGSEEKPAPSEVNVLPETFISSNKDTIIFHYSGNSNLLMKITKNNNQELKFAYDANYNLLYGCMGNDTIRMSVYLDSNSSDLHYVTETVQGQFYNQMMTNITPYSPDAVVIARMLGGGKPGGWQAAGYTYIDAFSFKITTSSYFNSSTTTYATDGKNGILKNVYAKYVLANILEWKNLTSGAIPSHLLSWLMYADHNTLSYVQESRTYQMMQVYEYNEFGYPTSYTNQPAASNPLVWNVTYTTYKSN